ncbi:spermatogenesis-associated protein 7-like isoform X2 [Stegostoma tigrinum]|uniref:spermatogenesis-associated protein 7-like isoform X2 n=1 Tax=Stegostoma tigrinum TaxID=3053191 RepID=UPI00202B9E88|nr:spermatogenesis-associated protein 7-like isoform X2 [Stegostoma tigrinum]
MGKISINMANKKAYSVGPSTNLMDPYLIQSHMTSHYNRILSAKATVDCSVPKSMLLSVKYKDQLKKQNLQTKYKKGFVPTRSESWSSSGSSGRLTVTETIQNPSILEHNEDPRELANGSMTPEQTCVTPKGNFSVLTSTADINNETTQKSFSRWYSDVSSRISVSPRQCCRSFHSSSSSFANSQHYKSFQDARQKTYSGDILEKHAHCFTSGQQFTPRILKKDAQSSLARYRYYTPVKKKKLSKKKCMTQETQTDFTSSEDVPLLKNKKDRSHFTSSQICSDDEREVRDVSSFNFHCNEPLENFEHPYDYCVQRLSSSNRIKSSIMQKVKAEEEELKYLEFISDITSEILARGLFSNSVLERIFERRIEENRHRLNEKLRHMLDELKEDLGFKPEKEWRTSSCETILTNTKMLEFKNPDSLENHRFSHTSKEYTGSTASLSIDNENEGSWNHRLFGNSSASICYDHNVAGTTHPDATGGERIQDILHTEQDHCLFSNSEENPDHFQSVDHPYDPTDSDCTDSDHTTVLTDVDNLVVSLHTVDVKENCELEDEQSRFASSKDPEKAFNDGINL